MSTECRDRADQRLLFVAGALDEAEREEFRSHLATCQTCAEVVRAAAGLLEEEGGLPSDEESVARVQARLARRMGEQLPSPVSTRSSSSASSVSDGGWLRPALAAAITALLIGGGAWLAHRRALAPLLQSQEALTERLATLEERLRGQDELRARVERAARAIAVLTAEDTVVVPLKAARSSSGASARIFWHAATLRCFMTAQGLPPLDPNRRYVMWVFTESGGVIMVGSFASDVAGAGQMYGELPEGTTGIARVVVTDEPEAIPDTPSGAEHLVWLRPT